MHIIIAAISAIAGLLFALNRLQDAGVNLNSFNPLFWYRRHKWQQQLGTRPFHTLSDPLEAAAVLIVGIAFRSPASRPSSLTGKPGDRPGASRGGGGIPSPRAKGGLRGGLGTTCLRPVNPASWSLADHAGVLSGSNSARRSQGSAFMSGYTEVRKMPFAVSGIISVSA